MSWKTLAEQIEEIRNSAGANRVGVAVHDYDSGGTLEIDGDRFFHAASTIKVAILLALFSIAEKGRPSLDSRVHVRNRFFSVADRSPFRVEAGRDAGNEVQRQIGKTMRVRELAYHMIVTSSNLATNLLVDLFGIDALRAELESLGIEGVDLVRGVEDEVAFEAGISNRATPLGLVGVMRAIEERRLSEVSSREMLDILQAQAFRSGIPAGVPDDARVANKTGEISTVAHDVAVVYPDDRQPYAIALLSEWDRSATDGRRAMLASVSRAIYETLGSTDD